MHACVYMCMCVSMYCTLSCMCGIQTLTVICVNNVLRASSYMCLYLVRVYVVFVSRAVCHVLAYTHAHTTHTCSNIVVEFRPMWSEHILHMYKRAAAYHEKSGPPSL